MCIVALSTIIGISQFQVTSLSKQASVLYKTFHIEMSLSHSLSRKSKVRVEAGLVLKQNYRQLGNGLLRWFERLAVSRNL